MISTIKTTRKLNSLVLSVLSGFLLSTLLCACPYHSAYQLDATPQIPVEAAYLGTWNGYVTEEVYQKRTYFTLIVSSKNAFEYEMDFVGFFGRKNKKNEPQIDSLKSIAFASKVDNRLFMNIKMDNRIYLAECIYENDELTLLPMAEEFTSFIIKKNENLRAVLQYHFKTRLNPSYDESFCMRNMKRENLIP